MTPSDLVFVGVNKRVAALDRNSGCLVWQWQAPTRWRIGYITLLLDGDRLVVSVNGYIYCLDPATGSQLWNNDMAGFGTGVASIASVQGQATSAVAAAVAAAQHASR